MKKFVSFCIVTFTLHAAAFTQCGINYKELLGKYCNGVYLQHQELDNTSNGKITLILKIDDRYAIYLLNPSKLLPAFTLAGAKGSTLRDVVSKENKKEKIYTYTFTAGETGEYDFSYRFNTNENACALMAIYLQNQNMFKPGIYGKFDEMKYNNPSGSLKNKIYTRVVKLGGSNQVTYYKLDLSRYQALEQGRLFGFSDGKNQYIKQTEGIGIRKDFVKVDIYGKYGCFEDIAYITTGTTVLPYLTINLIDMNSGIITRIDRKHLRELMANDPKLLDEYNNEPHKDKKLKEYLIRYLQSKNDE